MMYPSLTIFLIIIIYIVSWEQEGRLCSPRMFRWEPEGNLKPDIRDDRSLQQED